MPPRVYDGSGLPAPERISLRAGRLTMDYEAGTLRYIRLGNEEIVRGIYAAVRDHNWGTIPAQLCDVRLDQRGDSFELTFTSDHQQGDIHFAWQGRITGTADSTIRFTFDGEALTSFRRNRVGFCVLHPMQVAGKAVAIEHTDGSVEQGTFPEFISPHQPFFDIRATTHEVIPGVRAEVRMEGDTFEMEDQRNWTDASFKTYCTPLALPYPALLEAGTKVSQSITVRLMGGASQVEVSEAAPALHLNPAESTPLPPIGLAVASHGEPLNEREMARLKALNLSHLRVDVSLNDAEAHLRRAQTEAQALDTTLEVVLHLSADGALEAELRQFRDLCRALGLKGSLIVLRDGELATSQNTIQAALRLFGEEGDLKVGAGTNGFFTQLNRNRLSIPNIPLIAYSVNPQVHAFDNASLVETLPVMGETVRSARQFAPVARIAVTPVSLKIRWNPDATGPEAPTPSGQLPRRVDPRQMSLFGAGWTMGAVASLALAGADSLTFYETTGWLGIMERESGSPLPERFPSIAGGVYPMYHIFADAAEFVGGQVVSFTASHPLRFSGLALRSGDRLRLLVANHMQERQTVAVSGVEGAFEMKSLDETTAERAMSDPEGFRAAPSERVQADAGGLKLELLPYAVVRLDLEG